MIVQLEYSRIILKLLNDSKYFSLNLKKCVSTLFHRLATQASNPVYGGQSICLVKKNNSIGWNKRTGRIFFLKINKHVDPNNCVQVGKKSEKRINVVYVYSELQSSWCFSISPQANHKLRFDYRPTLMAHSKTLALYFKQNFNPFLPLFMYKDPECIIQCSLVNCAQ